jgi:hypothetical protein
MWPDNDVRTYGEGTKYIKHSRAGLLAFEYSAFAVDGRPDLSVPGTVDRKATGATAPETWFQ